MSVGSHGVPRLRLLSRPGCGLCQQMAEALEAAFGPRAYVLEWVDVDARDDWRAQWGLEIPVLLNDVETPLCVTRFDSAPVAAFLGCAPRRRPTA